MSTPAGHRPEVDVRKIWSLQTAMKINIGKIFTFDVPVWLGMIVLAYMLGLPYWIILGGFPVYPIGWLIYQRCKQISAQPASGEPGRYSLPAEDREQFGRYDYAKVTWNISRWRTSSSRPRSTTPEEVDVFPPSLCPRCQTALTQKRSFWGGFTWRCPQHHRSQSSRESQWQVSRQVQAIVKQKVEDNPWWPHPGPL